MKEWLTGTIHDLFQDLAGAVNKVTCVAKELVTKKNFMVALISL